MDQSTKVTIEMPYIEALHWRELILTFKDRNLNIDCLLCQALLTHIVNGIKDAGKNKHNEIKRFVIKRDKYKLHPDFKSPSWENTASREP